MITIKTVGNTHHLYRRGVSMRMCFTDAKLAEETRKRLSDELAAKLNALRQKKAA
jgi:elongation factor P--beta-lysine ligase